MSKIYNNMLSKFNKNNRDIEKKVKIKKDIMSKKITEKDLQNYYKKMKQYSK